MKSKITNMTGKLFFTKDGAGEHAGPIYFRDFPNAIWETYGVPHTLHLECLLVSLFSLTPPPVKKYFAGPDEKVNRKIAAQEKICS